MRIVNKNNLRILFPENGYELINKNTGVHSDKVYLALQDSMDNYIEVAKDDYLAGVNGLKEEVNEENIFLIRTIDSLLSLLEPVIAAMPMMINNESSPIDVIVDFYVKIIEKGIKDINDIPETFRALIADKDI